MDMKRSDGELKHLEFVRIIAFNALWCLSCLYDLAKRNCGPIKPVIASVEKIFTAIVAPLYRKAITLPRTLLPLLDEKVDALTVEFNKYAPSLVRKVVYGAFGFLDKSVEVVDDFCRVARGNGLNGVIRHFKILLRSFAIDKMASIYFLVSEIPLFHAAAYKALFVMANWVDKYNKLVPDMVAKGYTWLPLIPLEEFAKAYKREELVCRKKDNEDEIEED